MAKQKRQPYYKKMHPFKDFWSWHSYIHPSYVVDHNVVP